MEDNNRATMAAYAGVRVLVPEPKIDLEYEDRVLTLRVPPISETVRLMQVHALAEAGSPQAFTRFLDEFGDAVGLGDAELLPAEVFQLARDFFAANRIPARQGIPVRTNQTAGSAESPIPAGGSTT